MPSNVWVGKSVVNCVISADRFAVPEQSPSPNGRPIVIACPRLRVWRRTLIDPRPGRAVALW